MFKSQRLDIKPAQQALTVYSGIPIKFVDVPLEAPLLQSHFSVFDGFVFHPQAVKKEYQAVNLL
jgi:hypothetical protein